MKKISLFLFVFSIFFYFMRETPEQITTYKMDKDKGLVSSLSTKEEKNLSGSLKKIKTRGPASIKETIPKKKVAGRTLIGNDDPKVLNSLKMKNTISKDWKEKAAKVFLNLQSIETSVVLKKEEAFIKVSSNGNAEFFESVLVSYISKGKAISSFNALIDSETGQVKRTWNHTKIEHKARINLTPGRI